MSQDLQENMSILMGATNKKTNTKELSAEEKEKLSQAFFALFFGLAGANWGRNNKTLGAAWFDALGQIKAMISAKNKSNPAAMYLNQVFAAHNAKWSQIIMTNPNKDKKIELTAESKQKWETDRAKQIGGAMTTINAMLTKYQTQSPAQQITNPQAPAEVRKKMIMFIAAQKNIKAA